MRIKNPAGRVSWRGVPLVLGSAMCLVLTLTSGAQAAFPGKNGKIVFDYRGNIYTSTVSPVGGTHATQLTHDGNSTHARWSPDGKSLVFGRRGDIYTMSPTGTNVRRLTFNGLNYQPAWSRSGAQIVFMHQQPNHQGALFRMTATGKQLVQVASTSKTACGDDNPTWSPTSDLVVFHRMIGPANGSCKGAVGAIVTVNPYSGVQHVIARDGLKGGSVLTPDFMPNGKQIVIASTCIQDACYGQFTTALMVLNLQGKVLSGVYQLDFEGTDPDVLADPAVSPDGKSVAVSEIVGELPPYDCYLETVTIHGDPTPGLFSVPGDGACFKPVVFNPDWQPVH
jgi:Tol biopolymer transport system component